MYLQKKEKQKQHFKQFYLHCQMQKQEWGFHEIFQSKKWVPETKFEKHCLKAFFTTDKANYIIEN